MTASRSRGSLGSGENHGPGSKPTTAAAIPLILALGLTACGDGSGSRPDVLLITIDALRPDHMGLYGYGRSTTPNIDRAFAEGAVFERAYTAEANTGPSIASILSGLYPQEHRVRLLYQLLPEETRIIPDLLPEAHQTAAFVSNFVLTDEAIGLASRFDHYDDFVDEKVPRRTFYERNARRTTDAVIEWLTNSRDRSRPTFLWVHYIDPHGPYEVPPDWTTRFSHEGSVPIPDDRRPDHLGESEVTDGLALVDRYDEEVAYTDFHVGRLLDHWDATFPKSSVVLTADHGETMMERERWFTHGYHVYEELIRVPLLVRSPKLARLRHDRPVSTVDVAPTILELAAGGASVPLSGWSLLAAGSMPEDRTVYSEATRADYHWRAAIQTNGAWMARVTTGIPSGDVGVTERRYYALAEDPKQERPMEWPVEPTVGDLLLARIAEDPDPAGVPSEFAAGMRLEAPKVAPRADSEALEKLRALGYVH